MTLEECDKEKEQFVTIQGITVSRVGFICTGGFEPEAMKNFILIDGNQLY